MNQIIVSIKDRVGYFQSIATFQNIEAAIRWFRINCSQNFAQIKDDLTLYKVATIDVETGRVTPVEYPEILSSGTDFEVKNNEV